MRAARVGLIAQRDVRAVLWRDDGRWHGRLEGPEPVAVSARTRDACLAELRKRSGSHPLTVREIPQLVGVAEAASILGWDKRRIFTYLSRGAFPDPIAALASGRVWLRDDIETYSRSRRRRRPRGDTA